MGCHTWTYKKFKAFDEQGKAAILRDLNDKLKIIQTPYEEFRKSSIECSEVYKKHYKPGTDEYKAWDEWSYEKNIKKRYKHRLKQYKLFENGVTEDNAVMFCKKESDADYHIENGELYVQIGFDEPFRVYGFPEESFTDKDKLLNWLKTLDPRDFGYYGGDGFESGYTVELEDIIENYFDEHGSENLYFEFG